MSVKQTYEIDELSRVTKFVHALEQASEAHGVRIDSMDGTYLIVDGKDTNLHIYSTDGAPYVVSPLLPL